MLPARVLAYSAGRHHCSAYVELAWPSEKSEKCLSQSQAGSQPSLTAISAHFLSRSATYVYFLFRHYSFLRALRVEKDYNIENSRKFQLLKFIQKRKMASHCEFCGTAFWPYLKKCKGCHTVYYCDRDCQTQDWKYHKISCSGDVIRKAIEASSMASHSSKTSRPLRVSKIPDKVNIHSSKFKRKI